MTTPTKPQRARLFRLARLLDRVSPRKFDMRDFVTKNGLGVLAVMEKMPTDCGYAGCAIGWAQTMPEFRNIKHDPWSVAEELGMAEPTFLSHTLSDQGEALFGSKRRVGPRRVAADIRAYLKTGELPEITIRA